MKKSSNRNRFLSVILIVVLIVECYTIHRMPKGYQGYSSGNATNSVNTIDEEDLGDGKVAISTGIVFSKEEAIKKESQKVTGIDRNVSFPSGVEVTLDEYLMEEEDEHEVSITHLGTKSDDHYIAVGYDLTLDGEGAEFPGVAQITLPYDPEWGNNVFVQYYNEENQNWEILYTEAEDGKATFYTDHFSEYAVFSPDFEEFLELVKNKDVYGKNILVPVIPKNNDPFSTGIRVNYYALATYLRGEWDESYITTAQLPDPSTADLMNYTDYGIGILGTGTSGLDATTQTLKVSLNFSDKVLKKMGSFSNRLGWIGALLTVSQIVVQGSKNGDWSKVFSDPVTQRNLVSLGAWAVGTIASGGTIAAVATVVGIAIFVYNTGEDAITSINTDGLGPAEFAYRKFSERYILYNRKTDQCRGLYKPRSYDSALIEYAEDYDTRDRYEDYLPVRKSNEFSEWKFLMNSLMKNSGRDASDRLDRILTNFTNVFFNYENLKPKSFAAFLNEHTYGWISTTKLKNKYERPTSREMTKIKNTYKKLLYGYLKSYMDEMVKNQYYITLNEIFCRVTGVSQELNRPISFEIRSLKDEPINETYYADAEIYMTDEAGNNRIDFTNENHYCFSGIQYGYITNGAPDVLHIKKEGEKEIVKTIDYSLVNMKNIIRIKCPEPEEMTEATTEATTEEMMEEVKPTTPKGADIGYFEGTFGKEFDQCDFAYAIGVERHEDKVKLKEYVDGQLINTIETSKYIVNTNKEYGELLVSAKDLEIPSYIQANGLMDDFGHKPIEGRQKNVLYISTNSDGKYVNLEFEMEEFGITLFWLKNDSK